MKSELDLMLQFADAKTLKKQVFVKPALFIDNRVVARHSPFLGHFFTALADQSYRAALVCEQDCQNSVILSPAVEVIVHPPTRLPFISSQNRRRLLEQLVKFGPTFLHSMSQTKSKLVRQVAEDMELPYVVGVISIERFAREDLLHELCAGIISPSDTITECVKRQFPSISNKLWQINMGVFVEAKPACFTNLNRMPSIVVAQPYEKIEHFEVLFEAARHLLIDGYEFLLVLVGSGRRESELRRFAKAMGLGGAVNFAADNIPVRNIFLDSDIFVVPVPLTVYNAAILEAMSVGMVVAGPKGGVDDLLVENETAVLFDHKNPESIYSTLKMLLDRRDYSQHVAKSAQAYLKRNHTVTGMMESLIEFYHNVVRTSRHPG